MKSISDIGAHASDVICHLAEGNEPVIITLNGEAKAVLQDIRSYKQTQETLAFLKILALGAKDEEEHNVRKVGAAFAQVRRRLRS
jgi:prevent-host-death family protein